MDWDATTSIGKQLPGSVWGAGSHRAGGGLTAIRMQGDPAVSQIRQSMRAPRCLAKAQVEARASNPDPIL